MTTEERSYTNHGCVPAREEKKVKRDKKLKTERAYRGPHSVGATEFQRQKGLLYDSIASSTAPLCRSSARLKNRSEAGLGDVSSRARGDRR